MTDLLVGRYVRVAELGRGAMGDVWLAEDLVLKRRVAIKRIRSDGLIPLDDRVVERMVREARAAARIQHPNVVAVYDLITDGGSPYVVMEYVEGQTLAQRIRQSGRVPAAEASGILAGLASALETAHRADVVHRDVKPANILLDRDGRAKLADFGIARSVSDASLTEQGQVVGTIAFMAPEVIQGAKGNAQSDIYSLGATMFAAIDGRAPHLDADAGNTAALLFRRISEPPPKSRHAGVLSGLLSGMMATDPTRRPAAREIHRRVTEFASLGTHKQSGRRRLASMATQRDSRPRPDEGGPAKRWKRPRRHVAPSRRDQPKRNGWRTAIRGNVLPTTTGPEGAEWDAAGSGSPLSQSS